MALGDSNGSSKTYVGVFGGEFEVRVPDGAAGSKSRVNKNNKTIHYQNYGFVSGIITNIAKDVRDFQGTTLTSLKISMQDVDESYELQLSWSTGLTDNFFKYMENIDYSKAVKFYLKTGEYKGKEQTTLFAAQQNEVREWKGVPWKYSQKTGVSAPAWVKHEINGQVIWDKKDYWAHFENIISNVIVPKLSKGTKEQLQEQALGFNPPAAQGQVNQAAPVAAADDGFFPTEEPADSLPF